MHFILSDGVEGRETPILFDVADEPTDSEKLGLQDHIYIYSVE
jgi:hypothetical protein